MGNKTVWSCIIIVTTWLLVSREFTETLTAFHVVSYCACLGVFVFFFLFPPEELITGIGFSLDHLLECLVDMDKLDFLEAICYRKAAYHTVVASIPTVITGFFVHGNIFYVNRQGSRFPEEINYPKVHLALFLISLTASILYFLRAKQYKNWPFYKFFADSPNRWKDVNEEIMGFDTVRIDISMTNNKCVYFTPSYFVYLSNWDIIVARIREIKVRVKSAVFTHLHVGETDKNYIITLEVEFAEDYLDNLLLPIRGDFYRDFADQSRVVIEIPDDPTLPSCVSQNFAENFKRIVSENGLFEYYGPELEPCFGCGGSGVKVKLILSCTPTVRQYINHQEELVPAPICKNCNCSPIWCISCMGRIFHSKQSQAEPLAWIDGVAPCPTCRSMFCMKDIHIVQEMDE